MNRTGIFLAAAGGLALLALIVGLPRATGLVFGPGPSPSPPAAPAVRSDGSVTLTARLSHPVVATGRSDVFLTVDLQGAEVPGTERSPVNLAVVVDRSGSMSGFKLTQAKLAAKQLVSQLREVDRLAIVHYGSDVKSLESLRATAPNKERMLQFIEGIWDDGGTNIGAGLSAGRDQLLATRSGFAVNRMILISDGQPTEGLTEPQGLTALAREIRGHGITISSIGVGTDFNEDLMQAIAEVGSGAYGYLQDAAQLATLFGKDLQQAATTVARDVELALTLPSGVQLGEVLGYQVRRQGDQIRIPVTDLSAGQLERVVVRLTVDAATPGRTIDVSALALGYRDLTRDARVESTTRLSAMVTDKPEEALARRDKDAVLHATRARSAWNLNEAAEALRRGEREKAAELISQNNALFGEAAQVTGPAAVAPDYAQQQALATELEQARSDEDVRDYAKKAKATSRKNFGRLGSTY